MRGLAYMVLALAPLVLGSGCNEREEDSSSTDNAFPPTFNLPCDTLDSGICASPFVCRSRGDGGLGARCTAVCSSETDCPLWTWCGGEAAYAKCTGGLCEAPGLCQ